MDRLDKAAKNEGNNTRASSSEHEDIIFADKQLQSRGLPSTVRVGSTAAAPVGKHSELQQESVPHLFRVDTE